MTSIGAESFTDKCFESIVIPDSVTSIGSWVFSGCDSLASITFENTVGWELSDGTDIGVTNPATNATYLEDTYAFYLWLRK
ncbi:MAG: leucine-rich repeat protein [Clostridia bacterium]|nr:leucine-rich repeat protein [Clostridia bacterium]